MTIIATGSTSQRPAMARMMLGMFEQLEYGHLALTTPDGEKIEFTGRHPGIRADLVINDWKACATIVRRGDIGVAETYRDGMIDTSSLTALLSMALQNSDVLDRAIHGRLAGKILYLLKHLLNRNTRKGSKRNIHAHYDIGNPFYSLWLDSSMTYSSALFTKADMSLEEAQYAKYERILQQIDIKPGQHILEIGCGWGAFAEYAARTRNCHVSGISLSREQLAIGQQRIRQSGLENRVNLSFSDYRDMEGLYDAIVSVEMFEAVGESYWDTYFSRIARLLKPSAKAVIQTITIADDRFESYRRSTDFIQQYIFPGGMLPSPSKLQDLVTSNGLKMITAHEFGHDYAETLRRWRAAFENRLAEIRALGYDEAFIRLWRFYLCYCEVGFDSNRTGVRQITISH